MVFLGVPLKQEPHCLDWSYSRGLKSLFPQRAEIYEGTRAMIDMGARMIMNLGEYPYDKVLFGIWDRTAGSY